MNNPNNASEAFIQSYGGYAGLLAYQKGLVLFQGTVRFCAQFLKKRDRTVDQMIQPARSGKQNIIEGSNASGTSKGNRNQINWGRSRDLERTFRGLPGFPTRAEAESPA